MKSDKLLIAAAVLLSVCACVLTWRNVADFARSKRPPAPVMFVVDWQKYVQAGERLGAKYPRVTILEFLDYACGACRHFAPTLDTVLTEYPTDVAVVIRHLPILGVSSLFAARAAVCANLQGRFEAYHRMLIRQAILLKDSLVVYASRVGVPDTLAFRSCMGRKGTALMVAADVADADKLLVSATPTLLVNGDQYVGSQPLLEAIVERHLERQQAP